MQAGVCQPGHLKTSGAKTAMSRLDFTKARWIEEKVAQMQRLMRQGWMWLIVLVCGFGVSSVAIAWTWQPGLVEAREFRVVDKTGKVRMRLCGTPEPCIVFCGEDGDVRVQVGLGASGEPQLRLYDDEGKMRLCVKVGPEVEASLVLWSAQGRPVVWTSSDPEVAGPPVGAAHRCSIAPTREKGG